MELERVEIRTLPSLPRTPPPRERTKQGVCILVRDHTGLGDAEQGLGTSAGQGTARQPAGSDGPRAIQHHMKSSRKH